MVEGVKQKQRRHGDKKKDNKERSTMMAPFRLPPFFFGSRNSEMQGVDPDGRKNKQREKRNDESEGRG
jgi:capsid portal protein